MCRAAFIAVLGRVWRAGRGLDAPQRVGQRERWSGEPTNSLKREKCCIRHSAKKQKTGTQYTTRGVRALREGSGEKATEL